MSSKIKRPAREISPLIMLWSLVFFVGPAVQRTLSVMEGDYELGSKTTLSDGSWFPRFTSLRWAKTFNRLSVVLMQLVLESNHIEFTPELVMDTAWFELTDSHVRRSRLGKGWWA